MKSYLFNVHDVVLIMTISQCLVLVLFHNLMPVFNRISHVSLSIFFLLTALAGTTILLFWNEKMQTYGLRSGYTLPVLMSFAYMLCGPALYLYFRTITNPTFKLMAAARLIHLVPFALIIVLIFVFNITGHKLFYVEGQWMNRVTLFIWTSFKVSPVIYSLVCIYMLRNIGDSLMNHYSDGGEVGAVWAKVLVYGFLAHYTWSLVIHLMGTFFGLQFLDVFGILDNYFTFLMINLLFIYSLLYSQHLAIASSLTVADDTVESASLDNPEDEAVDLPSNRDVQAVLQGVEDQKLFLEHNITVEQFAKRVGLSSRDASFIINSHFNSNFFEFINGYRVEEAKSILASQEHKKLTVLDVLHMSGFNSKSAFHRFFKRMTGVSPTQYRKEHLK